MRVIRNTTWAWQVLIAGVLFQKSRKWVVVTWGFHSLKMNVRGDKLVRNMVEYSHSDKNRSWRFFSLSFVMFWQLRRVKNRRAIFSACHAHYYMFWVGIWSLPSLAAFLWASEFSKNTNLTIKTGNATDKLGKTSLSPLLAAGRCDFFLESTS